MSDDHNSGPGSNRQASQNALLDELDSLHQLLHEDHEPGGPVTSVEEIRSVKEYMALKQEADAAGMELDAWLARRAEEQQSHANEERNAEETVPLLDEAVEMTDEAIPLLDEALGDDDEVPMLDEVITFDSMDEVPATGDEQATAPSGTDEHVYAAAAAALQTPGTKLEQIEALIDQLVEEKVQAIKPQLKKQVFDEVRAMLPVDLFK